MSHRTTTHPGRARAGPQDLLGPLRLPGRPLPDAGSVTIATPDAPLRLEAGGVLDHASIAFEAFGPPPEAARGTVLVCHALTGDAHVTRHGRHDNERPGWWETLVGPGRAVDTTQDAVLCTNILGGCAGSTGPASTNPATGRPWGPDFPRVTITDMVNAQARVLDALGIDQPLTVIGGSIGGFQALEWLSLAPERIRGAAVIASGLALDAYALAFNRVARNAIRADALYANGRYDPRIPPSRGLAAARQLAHLTYRTPEAFDERFGRQPQPPDDHAADIARDEFAVQSYLEHKGHTFVNRFDANTYLSLLDAMDTFDADHDGSLSERLGSFTGRLLIAAFSSDRLFPPAHSERIAQTARAAGVHTTLDTYPTDHGHDAFLMPSPGLDHAVRNLLSI